MPDTPTTRLALPRPSGGDDDFPPQDFAALAARLDLIAAADDQGAYSAIGSPTGKRGFYYFATDTTAPGLFRSDGSAWVLLYAIPVTLTSVPAALYEGQRFAYRPDATNSPSIRWVFERRDGQWLLSDGAPLVGRLTVDEAFTNGPFTSTKVPGGPLIAGLTGVYRLRGAARCWFNNGQGELIIAKTGATALTSPIKPLNNDGTSAYPLIPLQDGVSLTAGDQLWFWMKTYNTGNSPQVIVGASSYFELTPIRVNA